MIATNDPDLDNVNQGGQAFMPLRSADTLMGLADEAGPEEVHLLERGDVDAHGDTMTGCFWAPEIHEIDGRLSILRSEEHTSELQSRGHLVCRLLLEKKKNRDRQSRRPKQHDEETS